MSDANVNIGAGGVVRLYFTSLRDYDYSAMLVSLSTEANISVTQNAGGNLLARRTPFLSLNTSTAADTSSISEVKSMDVD